MALDCRLHNFSELYDQRSMEVWRLCIEFCSTGLTSRQLSATNNTLESAYHTFVSFWCYWRSQFPYRPLIDISEIHVLSISQILERMDVSFIDFSAVGIVF